MQTLLCQRRLGLRILYHRLHSWVLHRLPSYSRRKKEEGRRKKEEAVIAMVSAIKNVLTVLAVAISIRPLAKVKNSPPSVPPRLRGEARKIRLPDREFGEGWGGVWCIFARGLLLILQKLKFFTVFSPSLLLVGEGFLFCAGELRIGSAIFPKLIQQISRL
jgi:hypothetical protein